MRYSAKLFNTRKSLFLLPCLAAAGLSVALSACGSTPVTAVTTTRQADAPSVVSSPVRVAHTSLGAVGYRVVGSGPPLVMITSYNTSMEDWDPRFVDALARHYRVVIFDNAGIGDTQRLPGPLTIDAMARQTGALIDALHLSRPDVLGWSMGGMIAQALAVLDPSRVHRLVLCATFPGTGRAVVPAATYASLIRLGPKQVEAALFPANQAKAYNAFVAAISGYPPAARPSSAVLAAERRAVALWWSGSDPAGRKIAEISAPTLIADGTADWADPTANAHTLASVIPGAKLVLYPDAAHAFLFQDATRFAAVVGSFLKA
jgi:pimeloyl-ACP methyl ester carboxylesterase